MIDPMIYAGVVFTPKEIPISGALVTNCVQLEEFFDRGSQEYELGYLALKELPELVIQHVPGITKAQPGAIQYGNVQAFWNDGDEEGAANVKRIVEFLEDSLKLLEGEV